MLVARDQGRVGAQAHRGPVDAVFVGREPVGPRVQQRDAHRGAAAGVAVHAQAAAEELLAAVAQRGADHPGGRDEGGVEVGGGRAQADRVIAIDAVGWVSGMATQVSLADAVLRGRGAVTPATATQV